MSTIEKHDCCQQTAILFDRSKEHEMVFRGSRDFTQLIFLLIRVKSFLWLIKPSHVTVYLLQTKLYFKLIVVVSQRSPPPDDHFTLWLSTETGKTLKPRRPHSRSLSGELYYYLL